MGMYNFLKHYLCSEIQNHFLKLMIFSEKSMLLESLFSTFSSVQIADAVTSENLIHPDGSPIIQLLGTHYECSEQNNLRHFSLTRVQNCTQPPLKLDILQKLLLSSFVPKR